MQYREWSDDLEKALAEPFPPEKVKSKRLGGNEITFVSWYDYVDKLNRLVGPDGWHNTEPKVYEAGGRLIVTTSVTILGVTKGNIGEESETNESYGSPPVNAFAQALKRTCALFGMGLDMYQKERPREVAKGFVKGQYPEPGRPATSGFVPKKGKYAGVPVDEISDVEWLQHFYPKAPGAWKTAIAKRLDDMGEMVPEQER